MSRTILVVSAHTDDEVLGCGGTIARHVAEGDTVYAVFLADGVTSRPDASSMELEQRNLAAAKAHEILGIKKAYMLGFPDNCMDSVPLLDIVQQLEGVLKVVQPDIVYTHHFGDLNIDHRVSHQAIMTACRPLPVEGVDEIYTFEVMSSTEWNSSGFSPFIPNMFVDISDFLDIKMRALDAYIGEMRPAPHSRSLDNLAGLARHRGNCVGLHAAEAFMVMRILR